MLSVRQGAFIRDESPIKLAHGSIRSSKTMASIIDWLRWVPTAPPGPLAVIGKTRDTVGRNVLDVIEQLDPKAIRWRQGAPTAVIMGRLHHVLGANDAKAETKVRGLTLTGALVDEVTLLPENLFVTVLGRLSVAGARLIGTTNPDSPNHWLRKKYLTRADELGWGIHHFTLDDNPGLGDEYKTRIKREMTGLFYQRFILGLWVAAEGAIYDMWDASVMVVPWAELPPMGRMVAVGVDHGTTNSSAAVLIGHGVDGRLYALDEWGTRQGSRRTDTQQADSFTAWLAKPHHPDGQVVLPPLAVDPAAASFRAELLERGLRSEPADNEVLSGIRQVASLLGTGQLLVSDRCTNLIEELPGYRWDTKQSDKGIDAPVKEADHWLDALRYGVGARTVATRLYGLG